MASSIRFPDKNNVESKVFWVSLGTGPTQTPLFLAARPWHPSRVGQGSKEPARGGVLGVSSATSFFLNFPYFYTFYCVTNTFVRVCLLLC